MSFHVEKHESLPPIFWMIVGFMIGAILSMFATSRVVNQLWIDKTSANVAEDETRGEITHKHLNNLGSMRMKGASD